MAPVHRSRGVGLTGLVVGALVPLAMATAWIPVRSALPNTDLALILVGAIAAVGLLRSRRAVVVAAVSGALWFEFFDTVPYEHWEIARNPDLETTLVLALVAFVGGEIVLRALRYRQASREDEESLTSVRAAAELVASGEELVHVIGSVAAQLTQLLELDDCRFEAAEGDPPVSRVSRDGVVSGDGEVASAELPVTVQGRDLGYFVLRFNPSGAPAIDRLRVAVTLADHVGAAFLAQAPPPPPDRPEPLLRVVGNTGPRRPSPTPLAPTPRQETAGLSSERARMIS